MAVRAGDPQLRPLHFLRYALPEAAHRARVRRGREAVIEMQTATLLSTFVFRLPTPLSR